MFFPLTQEMFDWIVKEFDRTPEEVSELLNVGDKMRTFVTNHDKTLVMCQSQNFKEVWLPVEMVLKDIKVNKS